MIPQTPRQALLAEHASRLYFRVLSFPFDEEKRNQISRTATWFMTRSREYGNNKPWAVIEIPAP